MKRQKHFWNHKTQHGGMLVELMMAVALAAIMIPFIFRYQKNAVVRARNIAVTKQMETVQGALEKYMIANKNVLMQPLGKQIYRVKISDLIDYGLPEYIADNYENDYQLRILKSMDKNDKSTLQGIIILNDVDITPLRTQEIVNLGAGKIGFIDNNVTHGGFGVFRGNTLDFGVKNSSGIVSGTSVMRGNTEYLWRLPSENAADSTMLSALNLDGHDVNNVKFIDAMKAQFEEKLTIGKVSAHSLTFANRITIEAAFATNNAVINGALTSDARTLNVANNLSLADFGNFSSFYTNDLYVNNMTLNGFSVKSSSDKSAILRIIGDMDLMLGHVSAAYVSVGYTGSVTPRLYVSDKIQDPKDSGYYWDIQNKKARFVDVILPELSRMAIRASAMESKSGTQTTILFKGMVANTNATVGDYINALNEIQTRVREKYHLLNLK